VWAPAAFERQLRRYSTKVSIQGLQGWGRHLGAVAYDGGKDGGVGLAKIKDGGMP